MRERDRFRRLQVRVAREHRVLIFLSERVNRLPHRDKAAGDREIVPAVRHAGGGREEIVPGARRMLLPPDLETRHLDQMALQIEIHVFKLRVERKIRFRSHRGHSVSRREDRFFDLFRDDPLAREHQDMRLIDVKVILERSVSAVFLNRRTDDVPDHALARGFADLPAMVL